MAVDERAVVTIVDFTAPPTHRDTRTIQVARYSILRDLMSEKYYICICIMGGTKGLHAHFYE